MRPLRATFSGFAALVALVSVVGACTDDLGGATAEHIGCTAHDQCTQGLICQAERCVDPAVALLPIALQLRYPSNSGELRTQYTGMLFEPGVPIPDLEPQELVHVDIDVIRWTEPIAAKVRFRAQRPIPGTSVDVWVDVSASGGVADLLPGVYEVEVVPDAASGLPPRLFHGETISRPLGSEAFALSLKLVRVEDGEKLVMIKGQIWLEDLTTGQEMPASDVRVFAVSAEGTHETQHLALCGGKPGCDGSYELMLPAQPTSESRTYQLYVEPIQGTTELATFLAGELVVGPDTLASAVELSGDSVQLQKTFRVAQVPPFRVLTGVVLANDTSAPVEGVTVSLHAKVGAFMQHSATLEAATDSSGTFSLGLPDLAVASEIYGEPAELKLSVSVHHASPYASQELAIDPNAQDVAVALGRKPSFRGVVYGRHGASFVADAVVQATPSAGNTLGGEGKASTNADGAFELLVEPGPYDLVVVPPPESGLPRSVRARIELAPDEAQVVDVNLGSSSVVYGRVLGAAGESASGVEVEVFAVKETIGRAVLIGTGLSDEDGVYRVIIPNPDVTVFFP